MKRQSCRGPLGSTVARENKIVMKIATLTSGNIVYCDQHGRALQSDAFWVNEKVVQDK